jgi:hypothetical protein
MADSNPVKVRRAVAAAQTLLREVDPKLVADGKAGTYTYGVYVKANADLRADVDRLLIALGAGKDMKGLRDDYMSQKTVALSTGDKGSVFDLQVVPALIRKARLNGIDPWSVIAQVALESNWGKNTPVADDGGPSYNYAGLKWNSYKTPRQAHAKTGEVLGGKSVSINDSFAVFDTPDAFAAAYFEYLLNGPSAYRYVGIRTAKTPYEYGAVLQKGGYATDPLYATKFAAVATSAERRYA